MAGNTFHDYIDSNTGERGRFPESLAEVYPNLVRVDEDAKQIINPPSSDETRAGLRQHLADKFDEDTDNEGDEPGEGE